MGKTDTPVTLKLYPHKKRDVVFLPGSSPPANLNCGAKHSPMAAQIDLSSLLSPDNASRNAAEQALDHMQQSAPGQLAMQLVDSLADHAANPVVRELCAVLLRRRLPVSGRFDSSRRCWREP